MRKKHNIGWKDFLNTVRNRVRFYGMIINKAQILRWRLRMIVLVFLTLWSLRKPLMPIITVRKNGVFLKTLEVSKYLCMDSSCRWLWITRPDWRFLRTERELKTISDIAQEADETNNKLIAELRSQFEMKTMTLSGLLKEKDSLHQAFYEGLLLHKAGSFWASQNVWYRTGVTKNTYFIHLLNF